MNAPEQPDPHGPRIWSAAFTPLQPPMWHDVRIRKRRKRRAPVHALELYSPLVVHTTPEHAELKAICNPRQGGTGPHPQPLSHRMGEGGSGVITRHHSHHYFGFAETQWKLFLKGEADEEVGTSCRSSEIGAAQQRTPYRE